MEEEMMVRLVELAKVRFVWQQGRTFEIALARLQPFEEHLARRLEVDHEIGSRHALRKQVEQSLIDEQLVVVEIQIGINAVFREDVIADRDLREQICLPAIDQLPMPVQKKEELRLKRRTWPIGIEIDKERVFLILA